MWRTVEFQLQLQLESSMWKLWQLVASWQLGASQDQVVADWLTDSLGVVAWAVQNVIWAQLRAQSSGFRFCWTQRSTRIWICHPVSNVHINIVTHWQALELHNCSNNCAATGGATESHWTMDPFLVFDLRAPLVNILFRSGHDWFFMFEQSNNSFISAKFHLAFLLGLSKILQSTHKCV